jgi:NAD(P)-dependent dehydrogenase (short-subunit alcohol dehydrogenase family)
MTEAKTVVITGSTRGIGYGLAGAFLDLGCRVAISGRSLPNLEHAVEELGAQHGADRVWGRVCDVTHAGEVQALWDGAKARFGRIDVWINNAGLGHSVLPLWEQDPALMRDVVESNLLGAMLGARVAIRGMLEQGGGSVYNLEGMGSDGRKQAGMTLYGCTKYGLAYLTDSLAKEMRHTPVIVGAFRPGMVVTRLLTDPFEGKPEEWARFKPILNILGERVETVAPYLARRALKNRKNGARIHYSSSARMMLRFLTAPLLKRKVVD